MQIRENTQMWLWGIVALAIIVCVLSTAYTGSQVVPLLDAFDQFVLVTSFGLLWPFMILGSILSLWRVGKDKVRSDTVVLLLLFASCYTAIHLLSWALIRYRLPVDALLLIPAALAIATLLSWIPRGTFRQPARTLTEL